jgi:hypothetical protein
MKQRGSPWIIGGAMVGAALFGLLGFLFGKYGLAQTDFVQSFPEFRDADSVGIVMAWLGGLLGLVSGSRYARHIAHGRDRARRRRREREEANADAEGEPPVSSSTRRR